MSSVDAAVSSTPVARPQAPALAWPAAVFAALLVLASGGADADAAVGAGLVGVLVFLAAIDLRSRVLPNRIVVPALGALLVAQTALHPGQALEWWGAAFAACASLLLFALVTRGGIGMGDVKAVALLGAGLGAACLAALTIAFVAVGLAGVALLVRHGAAARRMALPLGPFLALGALVVVLAENLTG